MLEILVTLALFGAALIAGFRRWGVPGALAAMAFALILTIVWDVWQTVAWHRYGHGPAAEIARAILRNWPCHALGGLPAVLLLGGAGTLALIACRRRFERWPLQAVAVAVAFALAAIPTALVTLIWTVQSLACDTL